MRSTVNPAIDAPVNNTIQGWGYPARDGNPDGAIYYSLGISLQDSPAFFLSFPDGCRKISNQIGSETLALHLAPIEKDSKGNSVSR